MILSVEEKKSEIKEKMRGGVGQVSITHHSDVSEVSHCRLLAEIKIPVGASIGEHAHLEETEFYLIRQGEGIVKDAGIDKRVVAGDVVITGNGASHDIRNSGNVPLVFTAIIVTEA